MKRRLNAYQALTKTIVVATLLLLFSGRLLAQCTGAQSFTANPTPLPGNTYNPGQVVTFCYTMVGFNEIGANWIDGFDLTIGAGWVPGSLTPTTPPANCGGGGGQWMWATSVTGQFSGATWGPGYFFDLNIDGNAGNDYGDQNSSSCTWNFCFTLTAGNTPGASLAVGVQALSDGQAGSWGSSACSGTPTTLSTATVSPPAGTVFVTAGSTICSGQSVTLTAVGATTYTWSPATGLSATTGATVTATPASTTTYTVTGSGGCGSCTATTTITVNPVPTVSILPAAPSVCPGGSVALTASGATTYTWSPGLWLSSTSGATVTSTPASNINYTVTGTTAGCSATATVPVTVNSNLTVSVSPASPSICIGGTGTTLTASGGTSYTWSPATGLSATTGTAVTANPTTTTTYTVTGTNASGCTGSTTVTVTANSLPTVTVNPAIPSICAGGSIVLTGMGASTYAWSPATGLSATTGTTVTANPTTNGYYTLTGTDANGCVGSHAFTLIVTTAVTGTVTTHDPLCTGSSDGMAAVTPLTGSAPFTYLWSNGQTGATAAGLPAGNVDVTVTDMLGCTGTATGTLADPPAITSSVIPFAYPGGDNVSCPGASDGSANLTVTGGTGDYTYLWSNGQTIEDANNLAAGNYTVTITDDNNCTATDNITLTAPAGMSVTVNSPATYSGYNVSCAGNSDATVNAVVSNGGAPYTYLWSNGATTQSISNGNAGNQNVTVTDANGCTATAAIVLTGPPGITTSVTAVTYFGGYNVTCNGASDGAIDLTVTNVNGAITYAWNNGATTQDISNLAAGNYTVLVTDANGCSSGSSIQLTQPTALSGTLFPLQYSGNVNVSCAGAADGIINATAGGGTAPYAYSWSNGQTTQNASNLAAGNYTLTITDANGCTQNFMASLNEPTALTTSIFNSSLSLGGFDISCNGASDGSADLTVSGGIAPYTYAWSNGTLTQDLSNIPAGNYTVTITDDNGCTATDAATLTEPTAMAASIASFTDVTCNGGNDGSTTVNVAGGNSPYTYQWETGQTTAAVTNFAAGIHHVTITDLSGCETQESITISQPPQLSSGVAGASPICIGQSAQVTANPAGGTPGYTYSWVASPADPTLVATDQSPVVSPFSSTTYTLTITDANGCVLVADPVSVPVNPALSIVLDPPGPIEVCPGESVTINCAASGGDGAYTCTVNGNAISYSSAYTNTPATTAYHVFTVSDNCGTTPVSDSVLVMVNPLPVVSFTANPLSGCQPLSVQFTDNTVPTPATYLWSFGDPYSTAIIPNSSSPTHTYNNAGTYSVRLTAITADGCMDSLTMSNLIEVFPLPAASFTFSPQTVNILEAMIDFNDQSSGATSWLWDFGDDTTSALVNPQHLYSDTGAFRIWLTVTSAHGCKDSTQSEVRITPDFMIYIPNAFTPDANGLNDGFRVYGQGIKKEGFALRIFNRWGEQVFATFDPDGAWYGDYNGNGQPIEPGVYVYTVLLKNIHNKVKSYKGQVTVLR